MCPQSKNIIGNFAGDVFFEKNPCHFLGIWYNEGRGWRYSSAGMSVRLTRERSWVRAPLSPLGSHTGTVLYLINPLWGRGSAGRASRSQREGRGFESLRLQEIKIIRTFIRLIMVRIYYLYGNFKLRASIGSDGSHGSHAKKPGSFPGFQFSLSARRSRSVPDTGSWRRSPSFR